MDEVNTLMPNIEVLSVGPGRVLVISIVVLYLGFYLNKKIKFLEENYIPPSVTGGILCSIVIAIIYKTSNLEINFDLQLRDLLLLVFFSTIGLSANFRTLASGGKALIVLSGIAFVFLIIQDLTGIGIAKLFGAHPGYGLMAGSISFAGGHGTAIAWGGEAEKAGLEGAAAVGIIFATFGLIAGGILGGPIAKRLINKNKLDKPGITTDLPQQTTKKEIVQAETLQDTLGMLLVLSICVIAGHSINEFLFSKNVLVPGFLTSMFVGIIITNSLDFTKNNLYSPAINRVNEVSLNIFLTMSLMSMQLWVLAGAAAPVIIALFLQMLVMALFAAIIVFRFMGKDYDAAVITAGFIGLGMGATPVAIANMTEVTRRFGPSAKSFLVVPLVGAFFIDIFNAIVIKGFIGFFS
jgi:ESS family glutamate:Na+ symporter